MKPLTAAQKEELRDLLGEAMHVGFRKGSFHPNAHKIWKLIDEMPSKEWTGVVEFVAYCLKVTR